MKQKAELKEVKINKIIKRKNFEIKFYESLIEKAPDFISVLIPLGDAYTRKGFYQKGLVVDRKLSYLLPNDPVVRYNLACSLSLADKPEEALGELKKAVLLGYDEFSYIRKDSDLANLRKLPEFKSFFAKIKKLIQ